jgi:flagellar biosynthesis anti-sigma factor FlgM
MKIPGQENLNAILGTAQTEAVSTRRASESATGQTGRADSDPAGSSLTLSARSQEADRIVEIAQAAPEYRIDIVEQARSDLAAGRMQPDSMAIATQMIQEIF